MSYNRAKNMNIIVALAVFALAFFSIGMTLYGLYLAFSASILLGFVALILEPAPAILGIVMFFWDKNLAEDIIKYLEK